MCTAKWFKRCWLDRTADVFLAVSEMNRIILKPLLTALLLVPLSALPAK